ncbi:MAG TPA: LysM peptidoglycan-binding domain-containing protein [Flavobacteriales bacterium]|nr:LysM peptidoglycan-binding domain-containing protein [Flavobacteriales bacterium]
MIRRLFLLVAVLALVGVEARAQEVRTVGDDKYIAHTVEKGETLFGLSRHYAVPLDALLEANPGAGEGLSIGQVVLVPLKAQSKKDLKTAPGLGGSELLHTVAKKETIYGIAKKYGVTQEELRQWNPDLQYGLTIGMVLRIQAAASIAAPPTAVQPAAMDSDLFHLVQPGETLFALGQRFGLAPDQIKQANGGLPEGLKAGTYVRIPREMDQGNEAANEASKPAPPPSQHRRVAILLPFTAAAAEGDTGNEEEARTGSASEAAKEFRAGLDIALDTLRAWGLNADVHVFDTGMKPEQWGNLFKSDEVRGMDMYIGPFHRAAIESLAKVAGGAPIICPVPQSNKVILGNPTVSKAVGGRSDRLKLMARYVAYNHARDNVILLKPEIYAEREVQDLMARELQQALDPQGGKLRDSLLVVSCGRRDVAAAVAKLSTSRPNILVVPSEDVEFVATVLSKFASLVPKYAITVYGMQTWSTMGTLDIQALVKLNVRIPSSAFLDYTSPGVNKFIAAYRARFRNEPGEYAFLGYDVALYFLRAQMQFGDHFPKHYGEVDARPIYLDFRMARMGPENGWSNTNAVMLEYRPEGVFKVK